MRSLRRQPGVGTSRPSSEDRSFGAGQASGLVRGRVTRLGITVAGQRRDLTGFAMHSTVPGALALGHAKLIAAGGPALRNSGVDPTVRATACTLRSERPVDGQPGRIGLSATRSEWHDSGCAAKNRRRDVSSGGPTPSASPSLSAPSALCVTR